MIDQVLPRSATQMLQARRRAVSASDAVVTASSPDHLAEDALTASAARKSFAASAKVFSTAASLQKRLIDTLA